MPHNNAFDDCDQHSIPSSGNMLDAVSIQLQIFFNKKLEGDFQHFRNFLIPDLFKFAFVSKVAQDLKPIDTGFDGNYFNSTVCFKVDI